MGSLSPLRLGRRPFGCRILLLYRLDPGAAQALLPETCHPVLVDGHAIAGLCYTSLSGLRNWLLPKRLATPSEHLAVRIAAEFPGKGAREPGTYILRRQTSSWIEARCGDKLLRGEYERAAFTFNENARGLTLDVHRGDAEELHLRATTNPTPSRSIFTSPRQLEEFLQITQAVRPHDVFAPEADELELQTGGIATEPLTIRELRSRFFDAKGRFPAGAAAVDCAVRLVQRRRVEDGERVRGGGVQAVLPTV